MKNALRQLADISVLVAEELPALAARASFRWRPGGCEKQFLRNVLTTRGKGKIQGAFLQKAGCLTVDCHAVLEDSAELSTSASGRGPCLVLSSADLALLTQMMKTSRLVTSL